MDRREEFEKIDDLLLQEVFSLREKLKISVMAIKAMNPEFDDNLFLHQLNSADLDQCLEDIDPNWALPSQPDIEQLTELSDGVQQATHDVWEDDAREQIEQLKSELRQSNGDRQREHDWRCKFQGENETLQEKYNNAGKKIRELNEFIGTRTVSIDLHESELTRKNEQIKRLFKLTRYHQHYDDCEILDGNCTCGLDNLIAEIGED